MPVSPGVRLALAYLLAFNRGERWPFDNFATNLSMTGAADRPPGWADRIRSSVASSCLEGIMARVGINPTVAARQAIAAAWRDGRFRDGASAFWAEVDRQVQQRERVPFRDYPW